MESKNILLIIISACLVCSGCATLTGYQDGKTLSEGVTEINVSLNVGQSQPFNVEEDEFLDTFNRIFFPNIELSVRHGISEKLDAIVRLSTTSNIGAGFKYQLLGDHFSDYGIAVGAELQNWGFLVSQLWNIQIPLYTSIHPTEKVAIYFTPRYIYQFSSFGGRENWHYLGGNLGILLGRKHKFAIDAAYYRLGAEKISSVGLLSFGVGGKFVFGGKKSEKI